MNLQWQEHHFYEYRQQIRCGCHRQGRSFNTAGWSINRCQQIRHLQLEKTKEKGPTIKASPSNYADRKALRFGDTKDTTETGG